MMSINFFIPLLFFDLVSQNYIEKSLQTREKVWRSNFLIIYISMYYKNGGVVFNIYKIQKFDTPPIFAYFDTKAE